MERPPFPIFESSRLRLRALASTDVDFLVSLDTDPAVMQYIGGPFRETEARAFALVLVADARLRSHWGRWIAEVKDTGTPIGWIELGRLSSRDRDDLQVGYEFAPAHWGRGYAAESLQLILGYCFTRLALDRVAALVNPENERSVRLLRHAGFDKVGRRLDARGILCHHLLLNAPASANTAH